ncbi:MAG TPA: hypothetical protein VLK65_26945 [Vicinamibacteria bacterium]|nr:hypothetical protein [Vicinamibacteria bacterium]
MLTNRGDLIIFRAAEPFVMYGDRVVARFVEQVGELDRKVLVDLELHALRHRHNALTRQVGCVRDGSLHRVLRQRWVALQNLRH